jgi:hypothetical protein
MKDILFRKGPPLPRFPVVTLVVLILALIGGVATPVSAQSTTFTPYGCWGNLGFEGGAVNISYWSSNGTAVTFVSGTAQAHTGSGALHLDGSAPISIWGTNVTGSPLPVVGDTVGGYFWMKILSAPTTKSVVDVQMTSYAGSTETIYCHSTAVDVTTLPLNTWLQMSLTPAGQPYLQNTDLSFNIVSSGGLNCLIDDVTFGSVTTTSGTSAPGVTTGIIPFFEDYAGSTFNGDFEIGSATTGNQDWGVWTPNQAAVSGTPSMMNLLTSGAGTEPGAPESGNNMVNIIRGGLAWDIVSLSSTSTDQLARVGDMVGGYYWLYVPANADLTKGFPTVYFISHTISDIDIADSNTLPVSQLQKGKWNQIPIYPVAASSAVLPNSAYVAIMVTAPQLDSTTNALYAYPYYIDNIHVGYIPRGQGFSPSSSLTDSAGNGISALGVNDTTLYANAVIQNAINPASANYYLLLELFQQGALASTVVKPVTVTGTGANGLSYTQLSISAPLAGVSTANLIAKLYLYDTINATSLAIPYSVIEVPHKVAPNDPNIKYIGRWTGGSAGYVSDYIRPYFKTTFAGTSVGIDLLNPTNLDVVLDGIETLYYGVSGLVQLGKSLSPNGTHTLKVSTIYYQDLISYDALYINDFVSLSSPVVVPNEIEFIGDSITAWNDGYSWLVPQALGIESDRIAWPGIALQDNFGYWTTTPPIYGMQSAYFDVGMPVEGSGTPGLWNFSTSPYTPNMVVINLGTNDGASITGNPTLIGNFQAAYTSFIQNVRAKLPTADIFVLRAFSIHYADVNTAIANAVQAVITAGDSRVHYIDTSSWTVEIGSDGIHPTPNGHVEITNYLTPILQPYLYPGAPSILSSGSTSFVNGQAGVFNVLANGWPAPTLSTTGLPPGFTLNASTGVLSGTPTQPGTYTFSITASNGVNSNATQNFTLTVLPAPFSTFGSWTQLYPSITGSNALPTGNPSHDGLVNLLKYAFDGNPMVQGSGTHPVVGLQTVSNVQYMTITYDRDTSKLDLSYGPQVSTDLSTWASVTDDVVISASATIEHHVASVPVDANKKFLRVQVTKSP